MNSPRVTMEYTPNLISKFCVVSEICIRIGSEELSILDAVLTKDVTT